MLTAAGCQARRERLLAAKLTAGPVVLADPLSLRYFANAFADPFSLGADYLGLLVIDPAGKTTLYHDSRAPKSVELAHVDDRVPLTWYDGKSAGKGSRRLLFASTLGGVGGRVHDLPADPVSATYWPLVDGLRRAKDPDEVDLLRHCMAAGAAGHEWARKNVRAGMTELDVYTGIFAACTAAVGHPVVLYGDFAVSPGSKRRGGPPDPKKVLADGETLILDFSVVIQGYRSDFTNTLAVGGHPTPGQVNLFSLCQQAMAAGEEKLTAGAACQAVYDAVRDVFAREQLADQFPHHAGHGLGLSHPEPPFFVQSSSETLATGDVVTLEPGLYVDGVGGVRIEHNYLVTDTGYERLSQHAISLT